MGQIWIKGLDRHTVGKCNYCGKRRRLACTLKDDSERVSYACDECHTFREVGRDFPGLFGPATAAPSSEPPRRTRLLDFFGL